MTRLHPGIPALAAFLLAPVALLARDPARAGAFDVMLEDMEATTVSFGATSLQLPGSHLRSDSADYSVELRAAPTFVAVRSTGLLPGALMITATPKFMVRRSDGLGSNPVLTPGYLPSVTATWAPHDSLEAVAPGAPAPLRAYYAATLMHHSNGQSGPFLTSQGTPNHVDGSFSLWSLSLTAHLHGGWSWLPDDKAVRVERLYLKEGPLDAFYPDWTVSLALRTLPRRLGPVPGRGRLFVDLGWMPRKDNDVPDGLKPLPWSTSATAVWLPTTAGSGTRLDFGIFARAYAGCDDYNINFDREVYRAELGLLFGGVAFGNPAPRP
jgi:hypothetical protein